MAAERLLRPGLPFPVSAVHVSFARSGGPGGQNVNKVETKVVARIVVGAIPGLDDADRARVRTRLAARLTNDDEVIVAASTTRSRERNLEEALDRLCDLLAAALRRPRPRRPTKPTRGSRERRLAGKKRRSETKRRRRPGGEE